MAFPRSPRRWQAPVATVLIVKNPAANLIVPRRPYLPFDPWNLMLLRIRPMR